MARRSQRQSTTSTPRSSSKRARTEEQTLSAGAKRPKRHSSTTNLKSTPTKSKYFEPDSEEDDGEEAESSVEQEESGNEDEEANDAVSARSSEEELESEVSDEGEKPKKRGKPQVSKGKSVKASKTASGKKELWMPGVKAGLGPGTQVVIKKPKARAAGDTPYSDETIHPNTMLFLKDLMANNNRQWMKMHDPDYRASLSDWNTYVECLTQRIIEADETVPELPVKDIVFRIYRDVRFSKDQTPYKTAFSGAWSRTGRKGPYAAYYVQCKPDGGSLIAGGLWMPEAAALAALRNDIDRRSHRLKAVLSDARLRKEFLNGVGTNEKKVVGAFCEQNSDSALKTKPKGYDPEHKDIELLRLRSFTIHKKLSDDEVLDTNSLARVSELISCLVPFITYLNSVVMPDQAEEPGSDDENGEDEEDEE
ncbi:hypothetical protein NA57DRAFT_76920 [Rhizodiscina lignyota]|uniref:TIGR02453 family protein n=1 Tax=Rhizodiscina lignyota TaxID=1504668 RepID=A0A9P4M5Q9_9PEZI|nr:hypothetical protein NA57DRAFT_76920 [Rhizodiscina lignyota]